MQYAIELTDLCKQYPKFQLEHVSFTLPRGYVSEKTVQEKQP